MIISLDKAMEDIKRKISKLAFEVAFEEFDK
jgi:hypothetical protein